MLVEKRDLDYYYTEPIEIEQEKNRKSNKKRKKKNQNKAKNKLTIIGFAIIGLVLSLYILFGYADITKMRAEITELENQKIELEKEKNILIAELEGIKSSTRVEDDAMLKLGMEYPTEEQIVYVDVEDVVSNNEIVKNEKFSLIEQLKDIVSGVFGLF